MTLKPTMCCILFASLAIFAFLNSAVAAESGTGTLIVTINDFQSSDGYAMVALGNSKESYKQGADMAFAQRKGTIENSMSQVVFEDVPYGEYAVSLYHDQNSNNEMDKNAMGIPKEPYAFSNNARGSFGKPSWKKVKFEMNSAEKHIEITFK